MMGSMAGKGSFYEDDEPLADVVAAFERGEKGVTMSARPSFAGGFHYRVESFTGGGVATIGTAGSKNRLEHTTKVAARTA